MTKWLRNTELLVKLGLIAFFSLLMWTGRTYPETSRLFPELLGSVTVILITISIALDFRKQRRGEGKEPLTKTESPPADVRQEKLRSIRDMEEKSDGDAGLEVLGADLRRKRLYQTLSIIFVSLMIGYLGGFLLTVPFFFIAFGLFQGQRKQIWKYMIIALGVTLAAYLFFTGLMDVPLLRGTWWG